MTQSNPNPPSAQQESTWERLKKTVLDLRITVLEVWGLIVFVVGLALYIYTTYMAMKSRVDHIDAELQKQAQEYKTNIENVKSLLEQFDKRLDQTQTELNQLK